MRLKIRHRVIWRDIVCPRSGSVYKVVISKTKIALYKWTILKKNVNIAKLKYNCILKTVTSYSYTSIYKLDYYTSFKCERIVYSPSHAKGWSPQFATVTNTMHLQSIHQSVIYWLMITGRVSIYLHTLPNSCWLDFLILHKFNSCARMKSNTRCSLLMLSLAMFKIFRRRHVNLKYLFIRVQKIAANYIQFASDDTN